MIHSQTRKKMNAGMAVDWSSYPAIEKVLVIGDGAPPPELVSERMRLLLEGVVAELRASYPENGRQLTPLDL